MDSVSSAGSSSVAATAAVDVQAKSLNVQKMLGQDAVSLISSVPIAQAPRGDGQTGSVVNVAA